jgi:hypothetical protein
MLCEYVEVNVVLLNTHMCHISQKLIKLGTFFASLCIYTYICIHFQFQFLVSFDLSESQKGVRLLKYIYIEDISYI